MLEAAVFATTATTPFPDACPPAPTAREEVWFLVLPGFSMVAFTGALEPMRLANSLSGRELYRWRLLSSEGGATVASADGVAVQVEGCIELPQAAAMPAPTIILCGGTGGQRSRDGSGDELLLAWLRRWARFGARVGALGSATHVLAQAGLLTGYRCTAPWQSLAAFAEAFPHLKPSDNLFEIDRDRFTCAGGAAALDLTLHRIAVAHGQRLADRVAETCLLDRVRAAHAPQRWPLHARLGAQNPKLIDLVRLMETQVEEPLSQGQLARRVGLSRRQVERLFRRHLGSTPGQHYLRVRLERARALLAETDLPVVGVACATGFVSASHFSTCYRQQFGRTPRMERARAA